VTQPDVSQLQWW